MASTNKLESLVSQGNIAFRRQEFGEAVRYYRAALEADNRSILAKNNLAVSFLRMKKYEESIELLLQILEVDPANERALLNIGSAYCDVGQLSTGLSYYYRGLAVNGNSVNLNESAGKTLGKLGRYAEAISCYQNVLRLKPDCDQAHFEIAGLAGLNKDFSLSIEKYSFFLTLQKQPYDGHAGLATAYIGRGLRDHSFHDVLNGGKEILFSLFISPERPLAYTLIPALIVTLFKVILGRTRIIAQGIFDRRN